MHNKYSVFRKLIWIRKIELVHQLLYIWQQQRPDNIFGLQFSNKFLYFWWNSMTEIARLNLSVNSRKDSWRLSALVAERWTSIMSLIPPIGKFYQRVDRHDPAARETKRITTDSYCSQFSDSTFYDKNKNDFCFWVC